MSIVTALYAYTPTDAGDLALQQNDRVQVTEHMNNDCKPTPALPPLFQHPVSASGLKCTFRPLSIC